MRQVLIDLLLYPLIKVGVLSDSLVPGAVFEVLALFQHPLDQLVGEFPRHDVDQPVGYKGQFRVKISDAGQLLLVDGEGRDLKREEGDVHSHAVGLRRDDNIFLFQQLAVLLDRVRYDVDGLLGRKPVNAHSLDVDLSILDYGEADLEVDDFCRFIHVFQVLRLLAEGKPLRIELNLINQADQLHDVDVHDSLAADRNQGSIGNAPVEHRQVILR